MKRGMTERRRKNGMPVTRFCKMSATDRFCLHHFVFILSFPPSSFLPHLVSSSCSSHLSLFFSKRCDSKRVSRHNQVPLISLLSMSLSPLLFLLHHDRDDDVDDDTLTFNLTFEEQPPPSFLHHSCLVQSVTGLIRMI